ncbi:MAG: hypothetical protein ACKV19_23565 [Verrucomicrobiales bacterium]
MTIADLLTNRTVEAFSIGEHGFCSIAISGGISLSQESLLRYIGPGIFISALDHLQQFGLPAPKDAEQEIRGRIAGQVIRRVEIARDTGDLTLTLDDGRIEIICNSAGYEAYEVHGPDNLIMVGRGGSNEISEPVAYGNPH